MPKDLDFIVLQTKGDKPKEFTVRPDKLRAALEYLVQHSDAYRHIKISEDNLQHYIDSQGQVEGIPTLEYDFDYFSEVDHWVDDNGKPVNEKDNVLEKDLEGDVAAPRSMVPMQTCTDNLKAVLDKAFKANGKEDLQNPTFAFPETSKKPLSEFSANYYSKCFPKLFPNGKGDYNLARKGDTPQFKDWAQHCLRFHDNRFLEDPVFMMVVANQVKRRTALALGNIVTNKSNAKNKTVTDIKNDWESGDTGLANKVRYFGKSLDGSPQYFYQSSIQALSFLKFVRLRSNETEAFNVFATFSCPDLHWDDLHRLFPNHEEYLGKRAVSATEMASIPEEERHNFITKQQDYLLRSRNAEKYAAITTDYFIERLEGLFKDVLEKVYGLKDTIIRFEFQHRGAIHAHVLMVYPQGPSAPEQELAFNTQDSLTITLEQLLEAKAERDKMVAEQKDAAQVEEHVTKLEKKVETIEAAQRAREKIIKFAVEDLGISEMHPNLDPFAWKPPYGLNSVEPKENVLRQTLAENMDSAQSLQLANERLINRVQIHEHTYR